MKALAQLHKPLAHTHTHTHTLSSHTYTRARTEREREYLEEKWQDLQASYSSVAFVSLGQFTTITQANLSA